MKVRQSARLVILNARDEVLLFHCREQAADPKAQGFWLLPGGGVEPGETYEAAALRELWEETGIEGVALGPWLWSSAMNLRLSGEATRVMERFFLVRVGEVTIGVGGQFDYERAAYDRYQWWPVDEMRASRETFFPEGLAELLVPIVAGQSPLMPIDIALPREEPR